NVVLPVEWIDLKIQLHNGIEMQWKAIEDGSVTGYRIEHSSDGTHWNRIASKTRKYDNLNSVGEYSYTDMDYNSGDNYYRIVQEFSTGREAISSIKEIRVKSSDYAIGPNPASDFLYIRGNID